MTASTNSSRPGARRATWRLDPYTVDGTITLQEWRRTRAAAPPVHIVVPQSATAEPSAA